jgi:protein-L-isoaspartate(D-aspartate) O-methyltransferase
MTDFTLARTRMIDSQLRTEDVRDPAILAAMGVVPRERFVPAPSAGLAYVDRAVPIQREPATLPARHLMRPAALARLLQLAEIGEGDSVLDVGAGTGYAAAVLARIAARVVALESDHGLAGTAATLLASLGEGRVEVKEGPLARGYGAGGPYDVIVIEGAVEMVPPELFDQLAAGGRLVAVIGRGGAAQATVFTRTGREIGRRPAFSCSAPPLPGFERPHAFVF